MVPVNIKHHTHTLCILSSFFKYGTRDLYIYYSLFLDEIESLYFNFFSRFYLHLLQIR